MFKNSFWYFQKLYLKHLINKKFFKINKTKNV